MTRCSMSYLNFTFEPRGDSTTTCSDLSSANAGSLSRSVISLESEHAKCAAKIRHLVRKLHLLPRLTNSSEALWHMSFRIERDESAAQGLRRLARKQLRSVRDELERTMPPGPAAVHEARKSLKKAR